MENKNVRSRKRAKGNSEFANSLNNMDPDGGLLIQATFWRLRPGDPDPEHPGEKVMQMIYRPVDAGDPCLCGSGDAFGDCCQLLPFWRPLCLDPDGQGFSPMHMQTVRFTNVPADEVFEFLQNDTRLYGTEHTPEHAFWTYWGDAPFHSRSGIICFGDFELLADHTLVITALTDTRMKVLRELVRPLTLGAPQIEQELPSLVEKSVQKFSARRRRRKL